MLSTDRVEASLSGNSDEAGKSSAGKGIKVTVVMHTLNEEVNLPYALRSVIGWADQVIVADSDSTDNTQTVAREHGAEVFSRACTRKTLVDQRNWALESLPIRNEWVFILDADEEMPADLQSEVEEIIRRDSGEIDGYWVRFKVIFHGRWLRRSSMYPTWTMRLFRRSVRYERRAVNAHPVIRKGREGFMHTHFLTEDHRPFESFVNRMNEFSTLEATAYAQILNGSKSVEVIDGRFFGNIAERRRFLKNLYIRLPARPVVLFFYLYVVRLGFLDGRPGLDFALYKAGSEWMTGVKARERLRTESR